MILVKGSSLHRYETKDFATDIVSLIKSMGIPVVWILGAPIDGNNCQRSPIDVLKQLVLQVLQINISLLNAQSPALNAARFQAATTEEQWFDLLASVLVGLPQLYIVVDAGILGQELSSEVKWPVAFLKLIESLSKVCPNTTVKVVLFSYGATPFIDTSLPDQLEESTIHIDGHKRHLGLVRSKRQGRRYGVGPKKTMVDPVKAIHFQGWRDLGTSTTAELLIFAELDRTAAWLLLTYCPEFKNQAVGKLKLAAQTTAHGDTDLSTLIVRLLQPLPYASMEVECHARAQGSFTLGPESVSSMQISELLAPKENNFLQ